MDFKKTITAVLIISAAACADIATVTVPVTMLHDPSAVVGLNGYSGKVVYTLAAGAYDSVFVTLQILPAAGGASLALAEVTGDVGLLHIVNPVAAETHEVYFQALAPEANVEYIARISAVAVTSGMKTEIQNYITNVSKIGKATLMGGGGDGFEALGAGTAPYVIPQIYMADGPHGIKPPTGNAQATCFPTDAGMACTWDTSLAFIRGQAKGEEFRAFGFNCSLGPALNLVYHPQGGRASEYYSEDPYLSGRMAAADVRGIQTKGVIATVKHFACNNKEDNRFNLSANMSERSIRELYLYNFKESIVGAGCGGIMGAYNMVNHSYANSNKYLMTDVLRNEWGYKSLVMTDWGANMDNFTAGFQYGADIEMWAPNLYITSTVASQADSLVNMHAARILYAHEMIGDLKAGYTRVAYGSTLMSAAHRQIVRDAGSAGIVLARNTGNILPLPKTGKKIAITGPFATQCRVGPDGSSLVNPRDRVTPAQGITTLLTGVGAGASTIVTDLNSADYVVVFVGVTGEAENSDRPNLAVQAGDGDNDAQTALSSTNGANKTIVVFTGGSAASPGSWSNAPAILIAFYPGQEQGTSIADVLFGNVNPSGKLPVIFPQDASQLPNFNLSGADLNYPAADTAHGYFRLNRKNQTPLFNFGHGLSYTTFAYSDLQIYPAAISAGDRVHVRVTVANTGAVAGKEVVELYLSIPAASGLPTRVQDLRGFQKVSLDPGASTTADFVLMHEEMQVWNPNGADYSGSGKWQVNTGTYGVRVGTSSQRDLQPTLSGSFAVQ
jgi:beta-glucosidase